MTFQQPQQNPLFTGQQPQQLTSAMNYTYGAQQDPNPFQQPPFPQTQSMNP